LLLSFSVFLTIFFGIILLAIILYDFDRETGGRKKARRAMRRAAKARKAGKGGSAALSKLVEEHHSEFVYRRRREMVAIRNLKINLTSG